MSLVTVDSRRVFDVDDVSTLRISVYSVRDVFPSRSSLVCGLASCAVAYAMSILSCAKKLARTAILLHLVALSALNASFLSSSSVLLPSFCGEVEDVVGALTSVGRGVAQVFHDLLVELRLLLVAELEERKRKKDRRKAWK